MEPDKALGTTLTEMIQEKQDPVGSPSEAATPGLLPSKVATPGLLPSKSATPTTPEKPAGAAGRREGAADGHGFCF